MSTASWLDPRQVPTVLEAPQQLLKPRTSGLTLWRPEIVLARNITARPARPVVLLGEPALRPEAVQAQMVATRSALHALAEARALLDGEAGSGRARIEAAETEREHVAAVIETYRVKRTVDDALRTTLRQVSALMEERGIR
jgi:hypothetical protein